MKEIEKEFIGISKCYAVELCEKLEILKNCMAIYSDCQLAKNITCL
jgi:hypothetical protein